MSSVFLSTRYVFCLPFLSFIIFSTSCYFLFFFVVVLSTRYVFCLPFLSFIIFSYRARLKLLFFALPCLLFLLDFMVGEGVGSDWGSGWGAMVRGVVGAGTGGLVAKH